MDACVGKNQQNDNGSDRENQKKIFQFSTARKRGKRGKKKINTNRKTLTIQQLI